MKSLICFLLMTFIFVVSSHSATEHGDVLENNDDITLVTRRSGGGKYVDQNGNDVRCDPEDVYKHCSSEEDAKDEASRWGHPEGPEQHGDGKNQRKHFHIHEHRKFTCPNSGTSNPSCYNAHFYWGGRLNKFRHFSNIEDLCN